ncbi:MAG: hypothetical protein ACE5H1_10095 [Thermodesulfobacteriota bacterium]
MPIIAKALAKVEESANLTIFSHTFNIQLGLPFSWKVFFLSAMLFATANLIFVLRCYKLIKDHNSFSDFQEQGKSLRHIQQYATEVGHTLDTVRAFTPSQEDRLQYHFWEVYDDTDLCRKGGRIACSLLYLFGFFLISIVLYQNIWVVLRMTF